MAILGFSCVTATSVTDQPLRQDAYVWQRVWTPAVDTALRDSNEWVDGWRVLAAETDGSGRLRPIKADWDLLARGGKPVTPVIRIDGQLAGWDQVRFIEEIVGLLSELQTSGVLLEGVEIDYDCATRRLPEYTAFIETLRVKLPHIRLSITALPAWLASPYLDALLARADETVLQVHAVRDPHAGLFDPALAHSWVEDMSRRIHGPFRVALPAYGVRVMWGEDGKIAAVEGEAPRSMVGVDATELMASPNAVASLLSKLRQDRPAHLSGVVWFRLPTETDDRAWSLATWHGVMGGSTPDAMVSVRLQESTTPGMSDVLLVNTDEVDAMLPSRIELPRSCTEADGINGYSLEEGGADIALLRQQSGLVHGHHERLIGWARCTQTEGALDAHTK